MWLTVKQAADYINRSTDLVYDLCRRGEVFFVKHSPAKSGRINIWKDSLDAYLASRAHGRISEAPLVEIQKRNQSDGIVANAEKLCEKFGI